MAGTHWTGWGDWSGKFSSFLFVSVSSILNLLDMYMICNGCLHVGCSWNKLFMPTRYARAKNGCCSWPRLCIVRGGMWVDKWESYCTCLGKNDTKCYRYYTGWPLLSCYTLDVSSITFFLPIVNNMVILSVYCYLRFLTCLRSWYTTISISKFNRHISWAVSSILVFELFWRRILAK